MSVIGVKIQQGAAAFENAEPLRISLLRVGESPGEVAREKYIKSIVCKSRAFRIHAEKFCRGVLFCASSLA